MNDFFKQAKTRLETESKEGKFDRYGQAMKACVKDALLEFCRQDGEFAQAVVQGGNFSDCMAAVSKCVKGSSISDLEAYKAAVQFYFPGAGINMQMTVDLCAAVKGKEHSPAPDKGLILDLSAFF